MVHADELSGEHAELHDVARLNRIQHRLLLERVLRQLIRDDSDRQAGAPDRLVHRLQHVGKRADVVLVPVCQDETAHLIDVFLKITHVRYHEVDAQHIVVRETEPAVNHDYVILVLKDSHILSDLTETSERDDL